MAASNVTAFPVAGTVIRMPMSFFSSAGALITGWTGAACSVSLDGAALQATLTPMESPAGSGLGYVDIPAAYTLSGGVPGYSIGISASVSNALALPFVLYAPLTRVPTATPSAKPTDLVGMIQWIFWYLFGLNYLNNQAGIQNLYIPNGNMPNPVQLCTMLTTFSDIQIIKGESTP